MRDMIFLLITLLVPSAYPTHTPSLTCFPHPLLLYNFAAVPSLPILSYSRTERTMVLSFYDTISLDAVV